MASAHSLERLPVRVFASPGEASRSAAGQIAELIRERAAEGRRAVLGLATGSTPQGVYQELVRLHRAEGLSFGNVTSFNLDEYYPMSAESPQSYRRFMHEHLFDHVDIDPAQAHVPNGAAEAGSVQAECQRYERKIREAGGIDVQVLGIGRTGHVGFNEPGSARDSRTRLITLDRVTRMDAASDFFGEWNVPRKAITMGVGTILDARRVLLLAFGEHKAGVIRRAVEGEVTASVAASFLQQHPNATVLLDHSAAAELTRFKTPWLLGPIEPLGLAWDHATTMKAAIWLARTLDKPILKLTDEDYNEHGLQDLLSERGGAYDINIEVFRTLSRTITGWPGGKPRSESGGGGDAEFPKRVVVFSPHPDDDVISMGGTLIRLCDQGHEVHVAYQTSGDIAVWDESALRHLDFVRELALAFPALGREFAESMEQSVAGFLRRKNPGQADAPELQRVKGLIRRSEARAAARYSGVHEDRIHFLDLPFYQTGRVRKNPMGEADVAVTMQLLERVKPHQVYAAGDLSDPHGTHRVCLAIVQEAVRRLAERDWMKQCCVWLYRGAWQEWGPEEIQMAVPLAPDEVARKRMAIFKHESQKDRALFPGPNDPREFWQRAEDRNKATARLFDALGLAEYEAMEGFVMWNTEAPQPASPRRVLAGLPRAVCSWSLRAASPADLAERARGCGVGGVQLHLDPIRAGAWDLTGTRRALADAGLTIVSGMMAMEGEDYTTLESIARTGGVRPDATWERNLAAAHANAIVASSLDIGLVTFHAGFVPHDATDPERAAIVRRTRAIADAFNARGVRVALETGQESATNLLSFLAELNEGRNAAQRVGVNFDPANMILYGTGRPLDALAALLPHVVQVHIKDASPPPKPGVWGTETAAGMGSVPWAEFLDLLAGAPAVGAIVIEREGGEERVADVRTARALLASLLD